MQAEDITIRISKLPKDGDATKYVIHLTGFGDNTTKDMIISGCLEAVSTKAMDREIAHQTLRLIKEGYRDLLYSKYGEAFGDYEKTLDVEIGS